MPRVDLARVVDLAAALEADSRVDPETLRRRDRTLGRELAGRVGDATARVEAWLDVRSGGSGASPGEHIRTAQRALRTLLAGAGAFSGAATALAVFSYDGSHPVNVVQVLAVFVGLPLLLLAGTALLALPEAWRRRVPGLAALQDVLRLASPGRWLPALRRLLPAAERDAFDRALGLVRRHQRLYGDAHKWVLLVASQIFAVAFHISALAVASLLVTFSDLAFGWSTTLTIDAHRLHDFAQLLATPWSRGWPEAAPTLALIEQTQYFRGAGGFTVDAPGSTAWWRFLLACMASYGLAPRLVLLGVASWRQRVALRRVFDALPGVEDLRDRLDSRWIATEGDGDEAAPSTAPPRVRAPRAPRPARVRAVRWSGVPIEGEDVGALVSAVLGSEVAGVVDGGAGSGHSDAALIAELAAAGDAPALLVKAWEPPLLELFDWLAELRLALGAGTPILVLPLSVGAQGRLAPADGRDARIWTRRLDTAGDPWLYAVTAEGSG